MQQPGKEPHSSAPVAGTSHQHQGWTQDLQQGAMERCQPIAGQPRRPEKELTKQSYKHTE